MAVLVSEPPEIAAAAPLRNHWLAALGLYALHVAALCAFAVLQPLLEILGADATFFVAHRAEPFDLVLFVALLALLLPTAITMVAVLLRVVSIRASRLWQLTALASLIAAIVLPVIGKTNIGATLTFGLAVALATLLTMAYARSTAVRSFATMLAIGLIAFPALFFSKPEISTFFVGGDATSPDGPAPTRAVPIVFVVLDELSLISLLDAEQRLDSKRFPGFGELAQTAYWFRNATSVADATTHAVTSLVTGRFPRTQQITPIAAAFPENLFSALRESHELHVTEVITRLCPPALCRARTQPLHARLASLMEDAAIVYLHWLLPSDARAAVPSITGAWAGFAGEPSRGAPEDINHELFEDAQSSLKSDRIEILEQFVEEIDQTRRPAFHFVHVLLPHTPYVFVPSGKRYEDERLRRINVKDEQLTDDPAAVDAFYRRGLFQLQAVDRRLSMLWKHLKQRGLFNDALIVLTSDHGVSYRPGGDRRMLTESSQVEILSIPLLMKLPGQTEPVVSDENVELIDVLPTIADVLGWTVPWRVDGRSLLSGTPPRPAKQAIQTRSGTVFDLPSTLERGELVAEHVARFGQGADIAALLAPADVRHLIGAPVSRWRRTRSSATRAEVHNAHRFNAVNIASPVLPLDITGTLSGTHPTANDVAIAVNGRIAAVARPFTNRESTSQRFETVILDDYLVEGANSMELFLVERGDTDRAVSLVAIEMRHLSTGIFRDGNGGGWVTLFGKDVPIRPGAVRNYLDVVSSAPAGIELRGWAYDAEHRIPATHVLMFGGDKLLAAAPISDARADVTSHLSLDEDVPVAFSLTLPRSAFEQGVRDGLSLVATSSRAATFLNMSTATSCELQRLVFVAGGRGEAASASRPPHNHLAERIRSAFRRDVNECPELTGTDVEQAPL